MILKNVLIVDYKNGESAEYHFQEGANLVISDSNSQGKSSLIKSIYFALGLKVDRFPKHWNGKQVYIKLDLFNERTSEEVYIIRFGETFYVSGVSDPIDLRQYTDWLSKQLGIKMKLMHRQTKRFIPVVYPSPIVTPFYIDQDEGWSGRFFSSTDELGMYTGVPEHIFDYLLGISDDEILNNAQAISQLKSELSDTKTKRANINDAYTSYINRLPANTPQAISVSDIQKDDQNAIDTYIKLMNEANEDYIQYREKRIKLERELDQERKTIAELAPIAKMYTADYKEIETICKHCNSHLTREQITTRMNIQSDLYEITVMISQAKVNIKGIEETLHGLSSIESKAREKYMQFAQKANSNAQTKTISELIDIASQKRSQEEFANIIKELDIRIGEIDQIIKDKRKDLEQIKKDKATLKDKVITSYHKYLRDISHMMPESNIDDVSFEVFKKPGGSGVNDNQTYLGLYLAYMQLVSDYGLYRLPFCIDSFIKNETSDENHIRMFDATKKHLLNHTQQSILSAITRNYELYLQGDENYNVIKINGRLLSADNFKNHLKTITDIISCD